MLKQLAAQLIERLLPQLSQNIKENVTKELRVEFEQRYNPVKLVNVILPRGQVRTKGSFDVEDLEDDDT